MKTQRLALALTAVNLVLAVFLVSQIYRTQAHEVAPVLRGRALEIVDDQGRIRANILVHGPETVNGKLYPETVLFRMTDPKSGPVVKLTASAKGSALGLSDDEDAGVSLYAKDTGSFVKVVDKKGREQILKP
ncbi:MAG TPA: hypothetical protein VLA93_01150 [Pyrinomonadaceae bacterium]|nr:hypothetical protein [Pyrinomonadaceae bacterium]